MDANKVRARRRLRRRRHIRKKIFGSAERPRLTVTRSLNHIYCQIIDDFKGVTLCSASSRVIDGAQGGNRSGAAAVGQLIGQRAKESGITKVAFDRNGYPYHGRVAALADAVRKEGIEV